MSGILPVPGSPITKTLKRYSLFPLEGEAGEEEGGEEEEEEEEEAFPLVPFAEGIAPLVPFEVGGRGSPVAGEVVDIQRERERENLLGSVKR